MQDLQPAISEQDGLTCGVLYVAGGEDYVDLAIQSARSLRQHEPEIAIDLVTDLPENLPSGLFDRVTASYDMHPREKLRAMPASRFERTLYVDSDTLFVAPLGDLFGILDRFECALCHDVRRDWSLIRQGRDHTTPYAFPQHNSGVFLYRNSPEMLAFLNDWAERFFADDDVERDQIILKDLLWESDLRYYVLPPEFNLRRVTMLDAWEPLDAVPTILHSHRFQDHMCGQGEEARGERIATLEALLKVEREALAEEWAKDEDLPEAARVWAELRNRSAAKQLVIPNRSHDDRRQPFPSAHEAAMSVENWDEFRTAFQVAKMGTVSGAAQALGVHHATVIRHIDALEGRLGVKLFQRHARGYTPTEAGIDLLKVAQTTDDQFSQLVSRIKGRGEEVVGELVVTSLPGMGPLLAPVLAEFQRDHPGLTVRYLAGERVFRLEYGEAHIAIRGGKPPQEPDNVVQPFYRQAFGLYAHQSYIDAFGVPKGEGEDLAHELRFVSLDDVNSRAPFMVWMNEHVPSDRIVFRTSDMTAMADAILAGAGAGFLPIWMAHDNPDLVQIMPTQAEWESQNWLVTHVDLHRTPKVQSFLTFLKARAKEWPYS